MNGKAPGQVQHIGVGIGVATFQKEYRGIGVERCSIIGELRRQEAHDKGATKLNASCDGDKQSANQDDALPAVGLSLPCLPFQAGWTKCHDHGYKAPQYQDKGDERTKGLQIRHINVVIDLVGSL